MSLLLADFPGVFCHGTTTTNIDTIMVEQDTQIVTLHVTIYEKWGRYHFKPNVIVWHFGTHNHIFLLSFLSSICKWNLSSHQTKLSNWGCFYRRWYHPWLDQVQKFRVFGLACNHTIWLGSPSVDDPICFFLSHIFEDIWREVVVSLLFYQHRTWRRH